MLILFSILKKIKGKFSSIVLFCQHPAAAGPQIGLGHHTPYLSPWVLRCRSVPAEPHNVTPVPPGRLARASLEPFSLLLPPLSIWTHHSEEVAGWVSPSRGSFHRAEHPRQFNGRRWWGLVCSWRAGVEGGDSWAWARCKEEAMASSSTLKVKPTELARGLDVGSQGEGPEGKGSYRPEYKEGKVRSSPSATPTLRLRAWIHWKGRGCWSS